MDIRQIQSALLRKGFDPGPITGVMNAATEKAIIDFKRSIGFTPRPYVGPLTIAALLDGRVSDNFHADEPVWLKLARTYLGLREYPGNRNNPKILEWWSKVRAAITDDETPWCAGFVGGVLEECSIVSSRSAAARSYANWGIGLSGPAVGCVAVLWRGSPKGWQGHVGFVVGKDSHGNLAILGGNQGDTVSIAAFPVQRVLAYRWPASSEVPVRGWTLPVIDVKKSVKES